MFKNIILGLMHRKPTSHNLIKHRTYSRSHYDTLNLPRNCSSKEIKNAFIELSKKYHPDVNKSRESQARFVHIVQAYNILSKPHTRRDYDLGLPTTNSRPYPEWNRHTHDYSNNSEKERQTRDPWEDASFFVNRNRRADPFYENRPYYGVNGVQKVSNMAVVFFCFAISLIGLVLQVYAIRSSFTFNREVMNQKSAEASRILESIKKEAEDNGNELQVQLVRQRMLEGRELRGFPIDKEL